jgi:hypothetical protein
LWTVSCSNHQSAGVRSLAAIVRKMHVDHVNAYAPRTAGAAAGSSSLARAFEKPAQQSHAASQGGTHEQTQGGTR